MALPMRNLTNGVSTSDIVVQPQTPDSNSTPRWKEKHRWWSPQPNGRSPFSSRQGSVQHDEGSESSTKPSTSFLSFGGVKRGSDEGMGSSVGPWSEASSASQKDPEGSTKKKKKKKKRRNKHSVAMFFGCGLSSMKNAPMSPVWEFGSPQEASDHADDFLMESQPSMETQTLETNNCYQELPPLPKRAGIGRGVPGPSNAGLDRLSLPPEGTFLDASSSARSEYSPVGLYRSQMSASSQASGDVWDIRSVKMPLDEDSCEVELPCQLVTNWNGRGFEGSETSEIESLTPTPRGNGAKPKEWSPTAAVPAQPEPLDAPPGWRRVSFIGRTNYLIDLSESDVKTAGRINDLPMWTPAQLELLPVGQYGDQGPSLVQNEGHALTCQDEDQSEGRDSDPAESDTLDPDPDPGQDPDRNPDPDPGQDPDQNQNQDPGPEVKVMSPDGGSGHSDWDEVQMELQDGSAGAGSGGDEGDRAQGSGGDQAQVQAQDRGGDEDSEGGGEDPVKNRVQGEDGDRADGPWSRPPTSSEFLRGHYTRKFKPQAGNLVGSAVSQWERRIEQEMADQVAKQRMHALSWKGIDHPSSHPQPFRLLSFTQERVMIQEKQSFQESSLSVNIPPPHAELERQNSELLTMYRQSSPKKKQLARSPRREGSCSPRSGSMASMQWLPESFLEVYRTSHTSRDSATLRGEVRDGRVLRRASSESGVFEMAQSAAMALQEMKGGAHKFAGSRDYEQEAEGEAFWKREVGSLPSIQLEASRGEEQEDLAEPPAMDLYSMEPLPAVEVAESDDLYPMGPAAMEAMDTESVQGGLGAEAEGEAAAMDVDVQDEEDEEMEGEEEEEELLQEVAAMDARKGSPSAEGSEGLTLRELGLRTVGVGGLVGPDGVPYPPGRLCHRDYGPVAIARSRVQRCRDHWSWLFMDFLEILLRSLSGEVDGRGEPSPDDDDFLTSGIRISKLTSSKSVLQPWSVSSARREFDWLERKFRGVEHSLKVTPPGAVQLVFSSALACWLKYWDTHSDGPPDWTVEDQEESSDPDNIDQDLYPDAECDPNLSLPGLNRRHLWGPQGSIQFRLLEQALLDDDWLDADTSTLDVLRFVGLSVGIARWQPGTAMMVLIRLLERMGRGCRRMAEESDEKLLESGMRTFVTSTLCALMSACDAGARPDSGRGAGDTWQPMRAAEIAEVALGEGIAHAMRANLMDRFEEVDRLYFGLKLGPGVVAMALVAELRRLGSVPAPDLMAVARKMSLMGCQEAAFQLSIQAVGTGGMDRDGFADVIDMVFRGRGLETVGVRFARLASTVKSVHFAQSAAAMEQPSSYIADFADAVIGWMDMRPEHRWAYEVTLNFVRLHSSADMASRELDLCARVILSRWFSDLSDEERQGGYVALVEDMEDPETVVGWPIWMRIGRIVEDHYNMPRLLRQLRRLAILWTYDKLDEDGTCSDPASLAAFDWALDSLLMELPDEDPDLYLLASLDPLEIEIADVLLSVAERMGGRTFSRWAHADETAAFLAQLLDLADRKGNLDDIQFHRAIQVGLRIWGWAMPKHEQLIAECEDEQEAKEVLERAVVAMWQSVAEKRGFNRLVMHDWNEGHTANQ